MLHVYSFDFACAIVTPPPFSEESVDTILDSVCASVGRWEGVRAPPAVASSKLALSLPALHVKLGNVGGCPDASTGDGVGGSRNGSTSVRVPAVSSRSRMRDDRRASIGVEMAPGTPESRRKAPPARFPSSDMGTKSASIPRSSHSDLPIANAIMAGVDFSLRGLALALTKGVDATSPCALTGSLAWLEVGLVDLGSTHPSGPGVLLAPVPAKWWAHEFFCGMPPVMEGASPPASPHDAGFVVPLCRVGARTCVVEARLLQDDRGDLSAVSSLSASVQETALVCVDDAVGALLSVGYGWSESFLFLAETIPSILSLQTAKGQYFSKYVADLLKDFEDSPYQKKYSKFSYQKGMVKAVNAIANRVNPPAVGGRRAPVSSIRASARFPFREGAEAKRGLTSRGSFESLGYPDEGGDSDGEEDAADARGVSTEYDMFCRPGMTAVVRCSEARTDPSYVEAAGRKLLEFPRPMDLPAPMRGIVFSGLVRAVLSCLTWKEWTELHGALLIVSSSSEDSGESEEMPSRGLDDMAGVAGLELMTRGSLMWSSWLRRVPLSRNRPAASPTPPVLLLSGRMGAASVVLLTPSLADPATATEEALHFRVGGVTVTGILHAPIKEDQALPRPRDTLLSQCEAISFVFTPAVFQAVGCIEVSIFLLLLPVAGLCVVYCVSVPLPPLPPPSTRWRSTCTRCTWC